MLKIEDIHTYYGDSYVIQGVSLEVPKGSVIAVLGRNGVGKTTLIRSIVGFTPARRGRIVFNGQDVTHVASHRIIKLGMGLVPQGRRVFPSLTVKENLAVAERRVNSHAWDFAKIYDLFPRLKERHSQRANTLSGGEQQMLAIARALMARPRVILMDEISLGLMPIYVDETFKVIRNLHRQGVTILLVEQNARKALAAADRGYVIETGEMILSGSSQNLAADPMVRKAYLGA